MGAEQVYPEHKPKVLERTVYMGISARLHVVEMDEEEARERYPSRYRARAVDFPDVEGFGITQEGALYECERALKALVEKQAMEGDGSD